MKEKNSILNNKAITDILNKKHIKKLNSHSVNLTNQLKELFIEDCKNSKEDIKNIINILKKNRCYKSIYFGFK